VLHLLSRGSTPSESPRPARQQAPPAARPWRQRPQSSAAPPCALRRPTHHMVTNHCVGKPKNRVNRSCACFSTKQCKLARNNKPNRRLLARQKRRPFTAYCTAQTCTPLSVTLPPVGMTQQTVNHPLFTLQCRAPCWPCSEQPIWHAQNNKCTTFVSHADHAANSQFGMPR